MSRHIEIYTKRNFSHEVRGLFADWFEEKNWNFDEKNPENFLRVNELLSSLLSKLDQHCSQPQDDLMKQISQHSIKKTFHKFLVIDLNYLFPQLGIFWRRKCS